MRTTGLHPWLPTLQSQEILNRPVFVLDILKSIWKLLKILKRFWTLLKILNRFWKLLKILNRFWTLLKILNRFWTLLKILNITENSEQILNIIFLLRLIYFTSFCASELSVLCDHEWHIFGNINTFDIFFHLHCMCLFLYCALIYNFVLGYSLTPTTLFFEVKMAPPFEHGFMTEKFV